MTKFFKKYAFVLLFLPSLNVLASEPWIPGQSNLLCTSIHPADPEDPQDYITSHTLRSFRIKESIIINLDFYGYGGEKSNALYFLEVNEKYIDNTLQLLRDDKFSLKIEKNEMESYLNNPHPFYSVPAVVSYKDRGALHASEDIQFYCEIDN